MAADTIDSKRDIAIISIVVLTLALTGGAVIAGETGIVQYIIGGGMLATILTLAYTHTRKGWHERTEQLEDHVRRNELTSADLGHLATMLAGQDDSATATGLDILARPYSQDGTDDHLMAFIAGDSRDISVTIITTVLDLLEAQDTDTREKALSVLHNTAIADPQTAADATATIIEDIRHSDDLRTTSLRQRAIFLGKNRGKIHSQTLTDSHEIIQDLLQADDLPTATMACLLAGEYSKRRNDVPEADIEAVIDVLEALITAYKESENDHQSHLRSFITAVLSVLQQAATIDPDSLQDRLGVLGELPSTGPDQDHRVATIARIIAPDHPRTLEPVFGELVTILDETDDPELQGTVLEALAHMGPQVTEGTRQYAGIIAGHLGDDDRRRPAAFLLFHLADDDPKAVAEAVPDLGPVLADDDPQTRRYGFGLLARLAPTHADVIEAHLETITRALEMDPEAGTAALTALFRYTREAGTDVLTEIGQQLVPYLDEDRAHGRMAAVMVAEAVLADPDRYRSLRPILEEMLDRDDPGIITQACRGLTEIGDGESQDRIQDRLGDDSHRVRVAAAKAFTAIGDRIEDDRSDMNPLDGASKRLDQDRETISEILAEEETDPSIQIDSDGDIHGDILIYGDKEITDVDESTEIRDSVQKDVEMDRD